MLITKGAMQSERYRRPVVFYASARDGFRDFLSRVSDDPTAGVLLPAFIGWSPREGSGVYDPVCELDLPAAFYSLRPDLTVDLSNLESALERGSFRAVVVIHYYGRTDPGLSKIRAMASRHRVPLVEDLAHGLFSALFGDRAGAAGDVALYSLHKMLPLRDGGAVVYADAARAAGAVSTRPDLAASVLQYDWKSISRARRRTFQVLTDRLLAGPVARGDIELLWPELADGDVPQSLPLYVLHEDRNTVYEKMNAAGFGVVSLYHTLIPQLSGDHPGELRAARRILNLPVHQDIEDDQIPALVTALERCL